MHASISGEGFDRAGVQLVENGLGVGLGPVKAVERRNIKRVDALVQKMVNALGAGFQALRLVKKGVFHKGEPPFARHLAGFAHVGIGETLRAVVVYNTQPAEGQRLMSPAMSFAVSLTPRSSTAWLLMVAPHRRSRLMAAAEVGVISRIWL